ncbi:aryl-alcohol dehydrogenase-like predicted oxidoreductase [Burkholderia ambifaria]|nr:aldo/keto reductase [Burkholderia ambifaria]MDR6497602.1 aryl-alcohol dehydrogenase-like predicted oxidoreductase [Burkholderia ambifaria]
MVSWYDGRDAIAATVDAVRQMAQARGLSPARIALAWVLRRPSITAPIVGLSKPHHLIDALAALDLTLDDRETELLETAFDRTVEPVAMVTEAAAIGSNRGFDCASTIADTRAHA